MARPSEDDRDAIDQAFAEMVAGYHLTAERPDPLIDDEAPHDPDRPGASDISDDRDSPNDTDSANTGPGAGDSLSDEGPPGGAEGGGTAVADPDLPRPDPPRADPPRPDPRWADEHPLFHFEPEPEPEPAPEPEDRFVPPAQPPMERPAWPVLVGWIGMGYAVIVVFAVAIGLQLPTWAGGLAVIGFVGAIGVLIARLPRRRPPDSGDGATL